MRQTYAEILSALRRVTAPRQVDLEVDVATALGYYTLDAPLVRLAIVLVRILGTGARLADEIGQPEIAWASVPDILEAIEHGAWTGKTEDLELLRELETRRQTYDLVRRTLDRLSSSDVPIVELSPAARAPRDGVRAYRLALRA